MKKIIAGAAVLTALALTGCVPAKDIANENMTKAADNFEIPRKIVFINGITDKYLLVVEGFCSITDENNQLEVICKTGSEQFKKHFLGLSDNVTYFAEQIGEGKKVSSFHYDVVFRPEAILPGFQVDTSVSK